MKIDNDKRIFVTSDTHFCHDKEFIWKARGFESIDEMNEKIIENWNAVVSKDDIIIHLGDAMLGNTEKGIECMKRLNGKILLTFGNHDTDNRITEYAKLPNVELIGYSNILKYKKISFYLIIKLLINIGCFQYFKSKSNIFTKIFNFLFRIC